MAAADGEGDKAACEETGVGEARRGASAEVSLKVDDGDGDSECGVRACDDDRGRRTPSGTANEAFLGGLS